MYTTDISNAKTVVVLVVVTFLVGVANVAAAEYGSSIVRGIINLTKRGTDKVASLLHEGKHEYAVCKIENGRMYDTGQRIWK